MGRSLVQRSPTEGGVSECDHESSTMRSSWPTGGLLCQSKKKKENEKGGARGTYTPRSRGKDNINIDLTEICRQRVNWINVAQDWEKRRALVKKVTNSGVI